MKYSLAVCEFNPLHNGHIKLIDEMKKDGSYVILIMSGNFCQRGEPAVLDKYSRARHAIKAGADLVIELPVAFATSPAEIFAKGAIKLLSSIKGEKTLFFGAETGDKDAFLRTAAALSDETKEFKKALRASLSNGVPFAEARENALVEANLDADVALLRSPNSILGVEYAKAIKFFGSDIDIRPVPRENNYNDDKLVGEYCSALAIRKAIVDGDGKKVKHYLPSFVYGDLPKQLPRFDEYALYAALRSTSRELKQITDCTEGLENRIKVLARACRDVKTLVDKLETRRYTRARISRIITNNALGVTREFSEKCLRANLYLKVLAVRDDRREVLSLNTERAKLITRKADADKLVATSRDCFFKDAFANDVYSLMTGVRMNEYEMKTVSVNDI